MVDRNLGEYQFSFTLTSNTTGNVYNVSLYGGAFGNPRVGELNMAAVAQRTSGTAAWSMWLAVGYNDRQMFGQDMTVLFTNSSIGDLYSTEQGLSFVFSDNDTSRVLGCQSSVQGINAAQTAAYSFMHYSRDLFSFDFICDSPVAVNESDLCVAVKEGTASLTDLTSVHDTVFCGLFVHAPALSVLAACALALTL